MMNLSYSDGLRFAAPEQDAERGVEQVIDWKAPRLHTLISLNHVPNEL
jgi:hypothetical protein